MTTLIATLGTRDIQVPIKYAGEIKKIAGLQPSKINPDYYLVKEPFEGGKKILDTRINPHFFDAPIVFPGVRHILENKGKIDMVFLVVTNQDERYVKENHKRNDTFYFGKLLELMLKAKYTGKQIGKVSLIALQQDISYYDKMYTYFTKFFKEGGFKKIIAEEELYILLQGGIDAINTAILLKSIEIFPKVEQLVKPDQSKGVLPLDFPDLFRKNFMKERIKQAINSYNYISVTDLTNDGFIRSLSFFGHYILNFNLDKAKQSLDDCIRTGNEREKLVHLKNYLLRMDEDFLVKQKLWFLGVKVAYEINNMSLFLLKVFTLSENILKPFTEQILGEKFHFDSKEEKHESWNRLIDQKPGLRDYLNNIILDNNSKLDSSYPNRNSYYFICKWGNLIHPEMESFINITNDLAILRNRIAHELEGMDEGAINSRLNRKQKDFTLDNYISFGERIFAGGELTLLKEVNSLMMKYL